MHHDREQFLAMYDEMADIIYRRCLFKTSDEEVAKDLMQETFTKVWDYIMDGKAIRNLEGFTYTVCNNLIKDYYKKKKSTPIGEIDELDPQRYIGAEDDTEAKSEAKLVLEAMDELDEEDKEMLLMYFMDGKQPQEIAEIMDARPNTISVRIHRAKEKLRELFE